MIGLHHIVYWLFPSGAAVAEWVAALATGCLVGAGFIQLQAIRKSAEEQRTRWKEENKPKAIYELNRVERDQESVTLWCANLGTVSFIISGIGIESVRGSEKVIPLPELKQYVFTIGTERTIDLDLDAGTFGEYRENADVKLYLQGPSEELVTDARPYWLWVFDGKRYGLRPGFQSFEQITCPKCKRGAANFRAEGITSMADLRKQIADVEREFGTICPNHNSSKNSRVTFGESDVI